MWLPRRPSSLVQTSNVAFIHKLRADHLPWSQFQIRREGICAAGGGICQPPAHPSLSRPDCSTDCGPVERAWAQDLAEQGVNGLSCPRPAQEGLGASGRCGMVLLEAPKFWRLLDRGEDGAELEDLPGRPHAGALPQRRGGGEIDLSGSECYLSGVEAISPRMARRQKPTRHHVRGPLPNGVTNAPGHRIPDSLGKSSSNLPKLRGRQLPTRRSEAACHADHITAAALSRRARCARLAER